MRRRAFALALATAIGGSPSLAAPVGEVSALVPPTRRLDGAALAARATALAAALADRLGAPVATALPPLPLEDLDAARARAARGAIDEAAGVLDALIERGAAEPRRIADPAKLVLATLDRAAIALARGESARADALFARLLRWDPSLAPPLDAAPRLRAAVAAARARLGARPPLLPADLAPCAGRTLVVLRAVDGDDRVELSRWDDCRRSAVILVAADSPVAASLDALAPRPLTAPIAPPPARAIRPGFVVALVAATAAICAGAVVAIWAARRPLHQEIDVAPHL